MSHIPTVQTSNTTKESGKIFISPKSTNDATGKLLILIHIREGNREQTALDLQEKINQLYYTSTETTPVAALEDTATKINSELLDFLPGYDHTELQQVLDIFIGVLHSSDKDTNTSELHFTKMGDIHLLIKHGKNLTDITTEAPEEEMADDFFGAITSGPLTHHQDTVLTTSTSLLDYFSEERLSELLSEDKSENISKELLALVNVFSDHTMFQALILGKHDFTLDKELQTTSDSPTNTITSEVRASMSELNNMVKKTDEIMTGSISNSIKQSMGSLFRDLRLLGSHPKKIKNINDNEVAVRRRRATHKPLQRFTSNLFLLFKGIFLIIFWTFKQLYAGITYLLKNKEKITPNLKNILTRLPSKFKNTIKENKQNYTHLPWRRRILLATGGILAITLIISIASGVIYNTNKNTQEIFTQIAKQIENKRSTADAALIYNNDAKAIDLIAEARVLLEELPEKPKELKERKAEIAASIFETYKQLQKIEEIESPIELVNLTQTDDGIPIDITHLAGNGSIFFGLSKNNKIYKFDIKEQTIKPIATSDNTISNIFLGIAEGTMFTYETLPQASLKLLDLSNESFSNIPITFNDPITEKTGIASYLGRLYVLDPRNRQIYKHQKVGNSYTRGEAWVTDDSIDLSSANSIAIDGNIWVTTKSGDLYKISKGESKELNTSMLDPGFNAPNFIYTHTDSDKVFVLDPPTRRVIILNKDGSIYKQYVSSAFNDMRSASIDEKNGTIYLLNGLHLFEIPIK